MQEHMGLAVDTRRLALSERRQNLDMLGNAIQLPANIRFRTGPTEFAGDQKPHLASPREKKLESIDHRFRAIQGVTGPCGKDAPDSLIERNWRWTEQFQIHGIEENLGRSGYLSKITLRTEAGELALIENIIRLLPESRHAAVEPRIKVPAPRGIADSVLIPYERDSHALCLGHEDFRMRWQGTAHQIHEIEILKLLGKALFQRDQFDFASDRQAHPRTRGG